MERGSFPEERLMNKVKDKTIKEEGVAQANLQKSNLATNCLVQDMLSERGPVVALVQEPYIGNGRTPKGIPRAIDCHHGGEFPRAVILALGKNLLLCIG